MAATVWDRDRIVAELREAQRVGADLSVAAMRRENARLLDAAKQHFGSYRSAMESAGINYDAVRRIESWSRERVIDELQRRHRAGENLSNRALAPGNGGLMWAMQRYLGSHRKALRAAGIDDVEAAGAPRRSWTRPQVLEELRAAYSRGQEMSLRRFRARQMRLVGAAQRYFGSFANAMRAAKIPYEKLRLTTKWTQASVIAALRQRQKAGKSIASGAMQREAQALYSVAKSHFGSYRSAVETAGFRYESVALRIARPWTRQQVVDDLRRMHADRLDLNWSAVNSRAPKLASAALRHFGTYRKAIEAIGLNYGQVRRGQSIWTRQTILQTLRDLHRQLVDLRESRFPEEVRSLIGASRRLFGSYRQAIQKAGLKYPPIPRPASWTAAAVLSALRQRHADGLDLRWHPTRATEPSLFQAAEYYFGSYRAAVAKAGIDYQKMMRTNVSRAWRAAQPRPARPPPWTPQRIIDELRRLRDAGEDLRPITMAQKFGTPYGAAQRLFGSYRQALAAAGIEPPSAPIKRWTRDQVSAAIRDVYRIGERLSFMRIDQLSPGLRMAAKLRFATWDRAVRAAGVNSALLTPPQRDEVLKQIRSRYSAGLDLSYKAVRKLDALLLKGAKIHFGSYRNAVVAAGIDPWTTLESRGRWNRHSLIVELRRLEAAGRDLRPDALLRAAPRVVRSVRWHFGTYGAGLKAAGIDPERYFKTPRQWSCAAVVEELRRLHAACENLRAGAIQRRHGSLYPAAKNYFESWEAALRAGGIDPASLPPKNRWSREIIVSELRRLQAERRPLNCKAVHESDRKLAQAIRIYFGSHDAGLRAAGIDPAGVRRMRTWTPELVVARLHELQSQGRRLNYAQLRKTDTGLVSAMKRHFGSHPRALEAAGIDPAQVAAQSPARRPGRGHWTEESVLRTLTELHASGADLRYRGMKEKSQSLFYAAKELFGSYVNAVRQVGIDYWRMSQEHLANERAAKHAAQSGESTRHVHSLHD